MVRITFSLRNGAGITASWIFSFHVTGSSFPDKATSSYTGHTGHRTSICSCTTKIRRTSGIHLRFFPDEVWSKSHVFPLHRRPFEGLMIPTPCDTGALLTVNYDITTCQARQFSHFFDMHMIFSPISVPCERLFSVFPFVRRFPANSSGFVEEVLTVGNITLNKVSLYSRC